MPGELLRAGLPMGPITIRGTFSHAMNSTDAGSPAVDGRRVRRIRRKRSVFWLAFLHVALCEEGAMGAHGHGVDSNSTGDEHRSELWDWGAQRPKRGVNFVRVPKTASTSFMLMLIANQLGGPDTKDYDCRHIPDPMANQGRGAQRSRCNHRKLRELRITHEKACAGPWLDAPDAPQGRDRPAWVTILRDPVERVTSEFVFLSSSLKAISWQNKYWAKRSWGWIISDEEEKANYLHPAYAHIQTDDLLAFASEATNPAFTRQVRHAVRSRRGVLCERVLCRGDPITGDIVCRAAAAGLP